MDVKTVNQISERPSYNGRFAGRADKVVPTRPRGVRLPKVRLIKGKLEKLEGESTYKTCLFKIDLKSSHKVKEST